MNKFLFDVYRKSSSCAEYLAIYDSSWPDPSKIIKVFCDGFSQPVEKVNSKFQGGCSIHELIISKEYPKQAALSQPEAKFLFHDYGLRLSYQPARLHTPA